MTDYSGNQKLKPNIRAYIASPHSKSMVARERLAVYANVAPAVARIRLSATITLERVRDVPEEGVPEEGVPEEGVAASSASVGMHPS